LIIMDGGRIVAEGDADALIASRVGSEVIEIHLPEGAGAEDVVARLRHGPWRSEGAGGMLYLYLRDGHGAELLRQLDGLDVARRRATLQDGLLTLTAQPPRG